MPDRIGAMQYYNFKLLKASLYAFFKMVKWKSVKAPWEWGQCRASQATMACRELASWLEQRLVVQACQVVPSCFPGQQPADGAEQHSLPTTQLPTLHMQPPPVRNKEQPGTPKVLSLKT